jgi:WD40 repeat protein
MASDRLLPETAGLTEEMASLLSAEKDIVNQMKTSLKDLSGFSRLPDGESKDLERRSQLKLFAATVDLESVLSRKERIIGEIDQKLKTSGNLITGLEASTQAKIRNLQAMYGSMIKQSTVSAPEEEETGLNIVFGGLGLERRKKSKDGAANRVESQKGNLNANLWNLKTVPKSDDEENGNWPEASSEVRDFERMTSQMAQSAHMSVFEADATETVFKGYANGLMVRDDLRAEGDTTWYEGHTDRLEVIYLDEEAHLLVTGCADGSVRVYNSDSGKLFNTYWVKGKVVSILRIDHNYLFVASLYGWVHILDKYLSHVWIKYKLGTDTISSVSIVSREKGHLLVLPVGQFPVIVDGLTGKLVSTMGSDIVQNPAFAECYGDFIFFSTTIRMQGEKGSVLACYDHSQFLIQKVYRKCEEGVVTSFKMRHGKIFALKLLAGTTQLRCYSMDGDIFSLEWISYVNYNFRYKTLVTGLAVASTGLVLTGLSNGFLYETVLEAKTPFYCRTCGVPFCRYRDLRSHFPHCRDGWFKGY